MYIYHVISSSLSNTLPHQELCHVGSPNESMSPPSRARFHAPSNRASTPVRRPAGPAPGVRASTERQAPETQPQGSSPLPYEVGNPFEVEDVRSECLGNLLAVILTDQMFKHAAGWMGDGRMVAVAQHCQAAEVHL